MHYYVNKQQPQNPDETLQKCRQSECNYPNCNLARTRGQAPYYCGKCQQFTQMAWM